MEAIFRLLWLLILPLFTFILHVFAGGFLGWFIGLFFGNSILGILAEIGITGYSMFQIGIFMGFISAFFTRMITFSDNRKKTQQSPAKEQLKK